MTRRRRAAARYVCIHGHFYQPPRENPWLESIEPQDSARPYPNWNQRILAECYRPNAAARIVDREDRISAIANNYERVSFNFGPTLLDWIAVQDPDTYAAITTADAVSARRFSGHGSAMAQAYNHMIMPLASARDRRTQVRWGIRNFAHHFGRQPEGMWLPETAVCTDTLEALAAAGVAFTVLAPGQARRVRPLDGRWRDVEGGRVDPGRVYRADLPSGRSIDLFFYDGATSSAVAFERLLADGGSFAARLTTRPATDEALLLHIATDGETYGHHHRYGDMALAYALQHIEARDDVALTNYGEFRARHPAAWEVEIIPETAWSCAHGVGRWCRDCGCSTGAHPDWSQAWRRPLRQALDWLRDALAEVFERVGEPIFRDPWAARDDYIDVVHERLDERRADLSEFRTGEPRGGKGGAGGATAAFFAAHLAGRDDAQTRQRALELLEMQRHGMLMYTSCGWFFDDLSGTEPVQILCYAARALELGQRHGADLEAGFLARLELARSNRHDVGDGRALWARQVAPVRVDLGKVAAHYAVSSLFERSLGERVYCYRVQAADVRVRHAGKATLAIGAVSCTSTITGETAALAFGALHFGDHNLTGGVRAFADEREYASMTAEVSEAFARADLVATHRALDRHLLDLTFSLDSLFRDHQEEVVRRILERPLAEAERTYEELYDRDAPLMRYLTNLDIALPDPFKVVAQHVTHARLERALGAPTLDLARIRAGFEEAALVGVTLDGARLAYCWQPVLERAVEQLIALPDDVGALAQLAHIAELVASMTFPIDLWRTQNWVWRLLERELPGRRALASGAGPRAAEAAEWVVHFARLCRAVHIHA